MYVCFLLSVCYAWLPDCGPYVDPPMPGSMQQLAVPSLRSVDVEMNLALFCKGPFDLRPTVALHRALCFAFGGRIMERFSERYHEENPGTFSCSETAYVLAFSLMMLNTDMYNRNLKASAVQRSHVDLFSAVSSVRFVGMGGVRWGAEGFRLTSLPNPRRPPRPRTTSSARYPSKEFCC